MRWSSYLALRCGVVLIALLAVATALLVSASPEEKRLSVYSNIANYSLTVAQSNNVDYVGLLELLEPLGTVSAKVAGEHWRFRYNDVECEFISGNGKAHIGNSELDLSANFVMENGRGLVPLSSLNTLLPRILGGPITFNQSARRLFVGNVAVHFTAQVTKAPSAKLVMNFTAPVNPMIATEPGKLRMIFLHDPVVPPGSPTLTFDSKVISAASFEESNGTAEIAVTSDEPVMASFSNDGRTITIAPPSPSTAKNQAQAQPQIQASSSAPPQTVPPASPPTIIASTSAPLSSTQNVFAVIDAAHGGDERGAALSDQLAEKDVTLSFARALRTEMMARGLNTMLLRDSDVTMTLDQRAGTTNSYRPAIYICVHASSEPGGVRLYSAVMPSAGENHGLFVDWGTAQITYEANSQIAESAIANEIRIKQFPVRTLGAPLRPLNNITTAALAIEISPTGGSVSQLTSPDYQQLIATGVAAGIADIRDKIQAGQK